MTPDIVIVGGGLAGCSLAWACLDRGAAVQIIDRGDPHSASRVAAGLITPLTGHKLAKSWRLDKLYPAAAALYARVESVTGIRVFDANTTLRILHTTAEAAQVAQKTAGPFAGHLTQPAPMPDPAVFATPFGAIEMHPAGRLDVPAFIAATRVRLRAGYRTGAVDLGAGVPAGVKWVVFCHGFAGNPHFAGVAFRATKGEVLTLDIPGLAELRTVNRNGTWLAPVGGGRFLAGSTYDHEDLTPTPTAVGKADILRRVAQFLRINFTVAGHHAGVRPIVDASRPVVLVHPTRPGLAYFNGLGSKGALTAPDFAARLADRLLFDKPMDGE